MRIRFLLPVMFLSLSFAAMGQEPVKENHFTTDFQFMSRGEYRNGGLAAGEQSVDDRAAFIIGRSRINFGYERPHLTTKLSVQHASLWGQSGSGSIAINEGWAMLSSSPILDSMVFFAKLGRQVLSYDDERILGADDWAMTGNTHDAITLGFNGKMNSLHVMLTYNQNDENMDFGGTYYAGAFPCKTMQNAWYHFEAPWFPLGLSLLYMNIGMQAGIAGVNEHVEWQQVAGGYLNFHHDIVSVEGAYYKQSGKSEKGIKIDAWMASAKAKLKPSKYYGFEAGYDFLSGDDYMAVPSAGMIGLPQHKVIKGFSSIFGSHHKFYGAMDFFYLSTYVNGFTPGLQNAYIGAYTTPIKGLRVDLSYHYLATSLELKDMEKTLGHELEASVSYAILEDLSLSVGMSYMTGTRTMELLKRASDDHNLRWLWVSLNANPRIFSKIW